MSAPATQTALARARAEHATPVPSPGQLWRARWENQAGVVLILETISNRLHVVPVSLDEAPDETAVQAPADANTLQLDLAIWIGDGVNVFPRVLDYKLGDLTTDTAELDHGSINWGPTDPRTLTRARLQDLLDALETAQWAPADRSDLDLPAVLKGADIAAVTEVLGSTPRAAALRRGRVSLTAEEADELAELLHVDASDLLTATQPPLPDDLVAAMDLPAIRAQVDLLAARSGADEVATWRTCAYGVFALAAREHDRRDVNWAGRIRAYFEAHLHDYPDGPPR